MISSADKYYMRSALYMGSLGLGRTWPNPSVGCVLVKNGRVVARARTGDGGRPHAERLAIEIAGEKAQGATAYVTLEPCCHHGKTSPCSDALINAGIQRVVIATLDPDIRVNGSGVEQLKATGIEVVSGVLEGEARAQLNGYILSRTENRPHITLKIASSADAKVALANGESKWITGAESRQFGHMMRARHDAIAVGSGTVAKDNPKLTCRIKGIQNDPVKVVFDTNLRLNPEFEAFTSSKRGKTIIFCCDEAFQNIEKSPYNQLSTSVDIQNIDCDSNRLLNLHTAMNVLNDRGITSLLVEGGPLLISSFIKAGLYDQIAWFRAPILLGKPARNGIDELGVHALVDKVKLIHKTRRKLGDDILDIYEKE